MLTETKPIRLFERASDLFHFKPHAVDGNLGSVADLYFDDSTWKVRYFVLQLGWINRHHTLISPSSVVEADNETKLIMFNLTKEQIEHSPLAETNLPLEEKTEIKLATYYGWTGYWPTFPEVTDSSEGPSVTGIEAGFKERKKDIYAENSHLHSLDALRAYRVITKDGKTCLIDDEFLDCRDWTIRYLIVKETAWLADKHALVSPQWISAIDVENRMLHLSLLSVEIESAPDYDTAHHITLGLEESLYRYYARIGYW